MDDVAHWRGLLATTSERTLEEMVRDDPKAHWTTGAAVRMLNIELDETINRQVAEAPEIERRLIQDFGHAGPAFAARLVEARPEQRATIVRGIDLAAEAMGGEAAATEIRTRKVFGLLRVPASWPRRLKYCRWKSTSKVRSTGPTGRSSAPAGIR